MVNGFSRELDESLSSMNKNLDRCKLNQEHIRTLQNENSKLTHYEEQFEEWLKYFWEKFQKDDQEQQSIQFEGPKTELTYWKKML